MTHSQKVRLISYTVQSYLTLGLSVAYADVDEDRRRGVEEEINNWGVTVPDFKTFGPQSFGPSIHYNVMVIVNADRFSEDDQKELRNIPGYVNGINAVTVNVEFL